MPTNSYKKYLHLRKKLMTLNLSKCLNYKNNSKYSNTPKTCKHLITLMPTLYIGLGGLYIFDYN